MRENPENYHVSEQISELLAREVVQAGAAPAATAGFSLTFAGHPRPGAGAGRPALTLLGRAGQLRAGSDLLAQDALFDLASVSKPIVACTLARLVARGALTFDTPLGRLLPPARGTPSAGVPLALLLSHRAGLEAHRPLFAPLFAGRPFRRLEALAQAASARRPDCVQLLDAPAAAAAVPGASADAAGFAPLYSDLGYLLIGAAIEALTDQPLDEVVEAEVAAPLGLELGSARVLRRRRPDFQHRVLPTETVPGRGGQLRGTVHDHNAWAFSGHGASGHAGLFGTANAVLGFGRAVIEALRGQSDWLPHSVSSELVRPRPGGSLRAGFDGKSNQASSAGQACGPETFGHLGYTGTSLWCDPAAGVATVLLSNRVCPTRRNLRIRGARPLVHDELFRMAFAHAGQAAGGAPGKLEAP